jgi:uncharacterized protein
MVKLFLIVATGAFAQFVDGALGMGYGTTASSVLIAAGLLPALVSASVHTAEIFTSLVSGASHVRFGNVDKGIVLPLATSGMAGGIFGAYTLASLVSSIDVKPVVGALLLLLGVGVLLRSLQRKIVRPHAGQFSKRLLLPLGFAGGALDAIGGGGWGPVATATLVTSNQTTPRYIIGSVNVAEFFVTMAIVLTFGLTLGFENFLWHITLPLMVGGMLIAPIAAYTSSRVSPVLMGVAVGLLLVTLNVKTVSQSLSKVLGFTLPSYIDMLVITLAGLLVTMLVIGTLFRNRKMPAGGLEAGADD